MFRRGSGLGFLFWWYFLLWLLGQCIKTIFSWISNFIFKVIVFGCLVVGAISYGTGMGIADLFMLIWDFVGAIIEIIKRITN